MLAFTEGKLMPHLPTNAMCVVFSIHHVPTISLQDCAEELWGVRLTWSTSGQSCVPQSFVVGQNYE